MEVDAPPSSLTEKPGPVTGQRACLTCSKVKARCIRDGGSRCQRRLAKVELKLDGIVTLLTASKQLSQDEEVDSSSAFRGSSSEPSSILPDYPREIEQALAPQPAFEGSPFADISQKIKTSATISPQAPTTPPPPTPESCCASVHKWSYASPLSSSLKARLPKSSVVTGRSSSRH
ncbi:hypothetical protein K440DRAFT_643257 [Wilcoxina mikolae CBS 423.85]|nr:hypothetical protein K440DRAFT_643257 [Wilcoxina mikolae CBS 423.85]